MRISGLIGTLLSAPLILTAWGCGSNSSTPPSATGASSVGGGANLTLSPNPASVTAGSSLTLVAGGGTPPYTFTITNGVGYVTTPTGYSTVYMAPSTGSIATLRVTDSANGVGNFAISIVSGSPITNPSPTPTTSGSGVCGGTYSVNINGVGGSMGLVVDDSGHLAGFMNLDSWNFPVFGTCSVGSGIGTISWTNEETGSTYTGNVSSSGGLIQMSGTFNDNGTTYNWSASQSSPVSMPGGTGGQACEGSFTATINGTGGLPMMVVGDEAGNIAGYLNITGYIYPILGACGGGSISFSVLDTDSAYTGTYTQSGTTTSFSGNVSEGGNNYSWSASGTGGAW